MFTYKIVLVGDFGVGKTSLIRRFVDNSFSQDYISSIGVSISKKKLQLENHMDSTMMIWDIEGKTDYKPIFKQYLNGAKAFIIVADLSRKNTIDSLSEHIDLCLEVNPHAPISIALNKSDLEKNPLMQIDKIKDLNANIISVNKTSAKDGTTVDDIFNAINKTLLSELA